MWAESEKMEALMDVEKRKMMEIAANSHINCMKFGATSSCDLNLDESWVFGKPETGKYHKISRPGYPRYIYIGA